MGRVKNEAQIFVSEHARGTEGDVWGRKLEFEVSCGTKCRDASRGVDSKGDNHNDKGEQYLEQSPKEHLRSTCLLQFSFSSVCTWS